MGPAKSPPNWRGAGDPTSGARDAAAVVDMRPGTPGDGMELSTAEPVDPRRGVRSVRGRPTPPRRPVVRSSRLAAPRNPPSVRLRIPLPSVESRPASTTFTPVWSGSLTVPPCIESVDRRKTRRPPGSGEPRWTTTPPAVGSSADVRRADAERLTRTRRRYQTDNSSTPLRHRPPMNRSHQRNCPAVRRARRTA